MRKVKCPRCKAGKDWILSNACNFFGGDENLKYWCQWCGYMWPKQKVQNHLDYDRRKF